MSIAVIGGSGVYDPAWLSQRLVREVETPYGQVEVVEGQLATGRSGWFINRHGVGHRVPPHQVNYRANVYALKEVGATKIIATAAVGSMNESMVPGAMVLPDQFIDFTKGTRPATYFEGGAGLGQGVVHTDMTSPFCPDLSRLLATVSEELGLGRLPKRATYVCTEGPRFETSAEIRAYRMMGGDLVGMTAVPEVVLARELGLCYQTLALVTNWAAGLREAILGHEEVMAVLAANAKRTTGLLMAALGSASMADD